MNLELPGVFGNSPIVSPYLTVKRIGEPAEGDNPGLTAEEKMDQEPFKVIDTDGRHYRFYAYAVEIGEIAEDPELPDEYRNMWFYARKTDTEPQLSIVGKLLPGSVGNRIILTQ